MQNDIKKKIEWMSQFQDSKNLPIGYETSLYLPGRKSPLAVTITEVTENDYRVDLARKSDWAIGAQAWRISKTSAVKNSGAQLFILKAQAVEALHE